MRLADSANVIPIGSVLSNPARAVRNPFCVQRLPTDSRAYVARHPPASLPRAPCAMIRRPTRAANVSRRRPAYHQSQGRPCRALTRWPGFGAIVLTRLPTRTVRLSIERETVSYPVAGKERGFAARARISGSECRLLYRVSIV